MNLFPITKPLIDEGKIQLPTRIGKLTSTQCAVNKSTNRKWHAHFGLGNPDECIEAL